MTARPPTFIRHPFPSSERGIFVMFIKYSDPTTDDRLKLVEEGANTNKLKVDICWLGKCNVMTNISLAKIVTL